MSEIEVTGGSPFDAIRRTRPDGGEYWSARELMPLMGYDRWERFMDAIDRARAAAGNVGSDVEGLFRGTAKKSTGGRPGLDIELSRFAAYLVAMNGDSRKPEVAAAQAYFAVRTHEAETRSATAPALPQDYPSALRALADSAEELASSRAALEAAAPKAHAWDEFMSADGDYSVNQAAKSLSRRSGTIIGETRLWRWLAEQKWTYRDHSGPRAYQRRVDAGLLVEKPHSTYTDPKTGEVKVRGVQVRVTPKGLERIDRDLNGQFELDVEGAAS